MHTKNHMPMFFF